MFIHLKVVTSKKVLRTAQSNLYLFTSAWGGEIWEQYKAAFLIMTRNYLKRTQAFPIKMLRFARFTKSLQYFWCAAPVQSKSPVMKEAHESSIQIV